MKNSRLDGASLDLNFLMINGDSGGLQANAEGQLRGINTRHFLHSENKLAELGLKPKKLSRLQMLSQAIPAQRVLNFIERTGIINMNSLLRGQEVGISTTGVPVNSESFSRSDQSYQNL